MLIQSNIVTKGASAPATAITGNAMAAFSATQQPRLNFMTASAAASYTAYTSFQAKPTTDIVFETSPEAPSLIRVIPAFTSSSATSTGFRVVGWSMYYVNGTNDIWVPTVLAECSTTITTATTKPTVTVGGTAYYTHAVITPATTTPSPNVYQGAAGDTSPASILVDTVGSQLVQLVFKASAGTAAAFWYTI